MNICVFSRSEGAGSATTRKIRGLTFSVIAYDDDTKLLFLHPVLQMTQLNLKLAQLLLVILPFHSGRSLRVFCHGVSS